MLNNKFSIDNKIDPKLIIQDSDFRFVNDYEKKLWDNKADSVICSIYNHGLMSIDDKIKLNSIDKNANYYIHPDTHPATVINETDNRFFMTKNEKSKLEYLENYIHPEYHNPEMILENSNKRFVSDTEKEKWNKKSDKGHKHTLDEIICNIDNTKDIDKPISILMQEALDKKVDEIEFEIVKNKLYEHLNNELNYNLEDDNNESFNLEKIEWGQIEGFLYNQEDLYKELNKKIDISTFQLEIKNLKNLFNITRESLHIDKINNTSDLDKPISNLCKIELNKKLDLFTFNKHKNDNSHITMEERMRWNNMCTKKEQITQSHVITNPSTLKIENYNGDLKSIYDDQEIRLYSIKNGNKDNNIVVNKSDISDNSEKLKGIDGKEIIETINELVQEVLGLKSIMCDFIKNKNPQIDINEYSSILKIKEELNKL